MRNTLLQFIAITGLLCFHDYCQAELILDIRPNAVIEPSGRGFIDVFIRSSDPIPVELASVDYRFNITDITESQLGVAASGQLRFRPSYDLNTPDDVARQSNSEQLNSDYVFFNQTTSDNFAAVRQDPDTRVLAGGDSAFNANDFTYANVSVTQSPRLLARLELEHLEPLGTAVSRGIYRISLDSPMSFYSAADPLDASSLLDPVNFSVGSSGIVQVSAVPEPSSFVTCLSALAVAGMARQRIRYNRNRKLIALSVN